ncbi:MAG: hypothetical protein KDK70_15180 [Myxococcales bacterium]|nr:hypothetical protein [Myxococcales bacterium]
MIRMRSGLGIALGAMLTLACGPRLIGGNDDGDDEGDTTAGPSPTSPTSPATTGAPPPGTTAPPSPGTTASPDPDGGTTLDGDDDRGFLEMPDAPYFEPCDLFAQDCPPGSKCSPFSNDGSPTWNDASCFPVVQDPAAIGEPCTVEGQLNSGFDDCVVGAVCFDVDPDTLQGTCRGLCTGSEDAPGCAQPNQVCLLPGSGFGLCLPLCDPLPQDCRPGEGCYASSEVFVCVPVDQPGQAGEACESLNACDAGLMCLDYGLTPDCPGAAGCCTAFCALDDPTPLCLPGQVCTPWYEPGQAPPSYELIGICALPGA